MEDYGMGRAPAVPSAAAAAPRMRFQRLMWIGLILLCLIGAAAVIRRMTALANPPRNAPPQFASLDAAFAKKRVLTLMHIGPALLFVVLVPFQFSRSFRNRHLRAHRWMGRTIMLLGLVIGLSALPMSRQDIADYLGLTIETVSRTLTRFEREKMLIIVAGGIRLLDASRAAAMAAA